MRYFIRTIPKPSVIALIGFSLALLAFTQNATCQVVATWVGNTTSWESSANWDVGYVPGYQTDVTIPSGLTFYPNLTYTPVFLNNMRGNEGASLAMYSGGNCQVNVYGNWNFLGTFRPEGGQINFRGSTPSFIGSFTFGDVNFAKYVITPFGVSMSTATFTGDIGVQGDCWIDSCNLETGEAAMIGNGNSAMTILTGTLRVGTGDFPFGFNPVDALSGTVEYYGIDEQSISGDFEYGTLRIFGTGYKGLAGNVIVHGILSTGSGADVYFSGHNLTALSSVSINGSVHVDHGGRLLLDHSALTFGVTGVFSAVGENWADGAFITRPANSTSFYSFTVGTNYAGIEARFATFEYMDSSGINIAVDSALVSPIHCFNHCRFQNGADLPGAALLTLNNVQDLVIQNADFPVMGQVNVRKTNGRGSVIFINASGVFAGEDYEDDPNNLITWTVFPDLFLPDTTHNFGQIFLGESANWLLPVINEGQLDLNISEITCLPSPPYVCDPSTPQTLQPLDTLMVEVVFQPQEEGAFSGTIMFVSNDPFQDTIWVSLNGSCVINSVHNQSQPIPHEFALQQNYPNPFNATTTLMFDLPIASQVRLTVYDVNGRHVTTLVDGWKEAGIQQVTFDGAHLASGIYFYELIAGNYHAVRKAILLK